MIQKKTVKIIVDIVMTVVLLFLMAFQVTDTMYHEWIGAAMLVLFLVHNGLNIGWYKGLFKGKYSLLRVVRTIINLLVLISILLTGYSGIVMSRFVFAFLPISGGMATARMMHMAGSYWSFVFMGLHLGFHWSMVTNKMKKQDADQRATIAIWIPRIAALAIAVYGAVLFARADNYSYMLLQNHFVMLDYEKAGALVLLENLIMLTTWVYVGHYFIQGLSKLYSKKTEEKAKIQGGMTIVLAILVVLCTVFANPSGNQEPSWESQSTTDTQAEQGQAETPEEDIMADDGQQQGQSATETDQSDNIQNTETVAPPEDFILISGGTFQMGSPDTENWRSEDETLHTITVSDFYISAYEVTQEEYEMVMGENPSNFAGRRLPVENMTWLDAVTYCNMRSQQEGLTPAYQIDGDVVSWDRSANGYRLPTEAEWEYACRAGTTTPFNTETSISPEESNYYGHYPYEIEGNYFEQENLTTKPGQYRQTTVDVDSFSPNPWGLYNTHGNVSEWVWDYYGTYDTEASTDPTGSNTGSLKVYRGGGWNDFAKNMRSAYRATLEPNLGSFNIGIRLVRNAGSGHDDIVGGENAATRTAGGQAEKVLIAYFSWGGNTRGIAETIQEQTGADLFEITLVEPYSTSYNTVLDQSQHDQNIQARPEIAGHVDNMDEYDTIILGYPNWWASIPMPIASFLEEYDFAGKTIIPFCSHGGGRFGQSLTAIAKLAPDAVMGEGLSVHYSGGSGLGQDVAQWLEDNGIS